MNKMKQQRKWQLDGKWLTGEGVWLAGLEGMSLDRMRDVLFAWHAPSWYGADVQPLTVEGQKGWLLAPLLAMDYLARPRHVRLLELQWSGELQLLQRAARLVREALVNGWFAPSRSGWQAGGGQHWRIDTDAVAKHSADLWPAGAMSSRAGSGNRSGSGIWSGGLGVTLLDEWLNLAVADIVAQAPAAQAAWSQLVARIGEPDSAPAAAGGYVTGSSGTIDEEEWWIAIGWKADQLPFRLALQLLEPADGQGWRLLAVAQDRQAPERLYWLGAAQGEALPAQWEREVADKLVRERRKWMSLFPEWVNEAALTGLREELTDREAWSFLEEGGLRLLAAGASVLLPGWWEAARTRKLRLKARVRSSVGGTEQTVFGLQTIVEFDWKLAVGELELSDAEFRQLVEQNRRLVRVKDQWVHLDPADLARLRKLLKRKGKGAQERGNGNGLSLQEVFEAYLKGSLELGEQGEDGNDKLSAEVELDGQLSSMMEHLLHTSSLPSVPVPDAFEGQLRPYQEEGLSWMLFLRQFGLGGCLADDMGLGKTIQFMAYLLHVAPQAALPSLLICPTSVIGNWEKELAKFAPSLRIHAHYGPKRLKGDAFREALGGLDLVITSYTLAALDLEELEAVEWNALCLDEAQHIKNIYTKQSAAIRQLRALHRLALTGTPMENRLTELWSIYDFLNPGYLGELGEFRREVVLPIERTREPALIARLQRWVQPFMLRRLKKDPAIQLDLPDKLESKVYVSLTPEQGSLYEHLVEELLRKLDTLSPMQRRGAILSTLTRLKQLCDHPALLLKEKLEGADLNSLVERSSKLARLTELVDTIAAEGGRCLVFTQFIGMGRMLQQLLSRQLGTQVPYLHGGVPKDMRDAMIAAFQRQPAFDITNETAALAQADGSANGASNVAANGGSGAFVLSLKAGGTGLNLTAANHVIHFDRWWNPAVENQATDRAFRIGQLRDVHVHKFVTLGTLEEKIDDMLTRKQALNEQVVSQSERWITELSREELADIFMLRSSWLRDRANE